MTLLSTQLSSVPIEGFALFGLGVLASHLIPRSLPFALATHPSAIGPDAQVAAGERVPMLAVGLARVHSRGSLAAPNAVDVPRHGLQVVKVHAKVYAAKMVERFVGVKRAALLLPAPAMSRLRPAVARDGAVALGVGSSLPDVTGRGEWPRPLVPHLASAQSAMMTRNEPARLALDVPTSSVGAGRDSGGLTAPALTETERNVWHSRECIR